MAAETRLRVLHVIPSVAISDGGPSHAMAAIEAALSDAGIAVTTATTDHDYRGQGVQPSGVMARDPRVERHYARKRIGFYKVAPGLVPYFLHSIGSYDVVHIHALFSFAPVVAAWIARWRNVPYIVRPLGTLGSYGVGQRRRRLKRLSIALIEGPILRHAAAVHFTSQSELDEAGRTGIACRGVVIPLGVPGPPRANAGLREQHSFPGQCRSVLFLSRLDPKKNIEGLIDAFGASQELQRTCRLLIAGDGPLAYVEALKRRVALAGFGEQVVWLGHVADESKAAAFARADVFVLPSFSENFGIAAAEAMLAGLPCVLSHGVAIAAEAEAAGAAVAVSPDPAALKAAICGLLADDAARKAMGARARAFAQQTYSTASMAHRLVELYASIRKKPEERGA